MNVQPVSFQILGYAVQLARPDRWPLIVLACLCVGLLGFAIASRRRRLVALSENERLLGKMIRGAGASRELLRGICTASGLMLFALAALQPQSGQKESRIQSKGIDLVVAIDASRSMLGRDVLPSRLERARLELSRLIDRLQGDRVGIVVFAGQAFVQCPLTSDYGAARLFLRAIDPESMPSQGTAVAEALNTASTMLENADRGASTRVVLLLSDGEDHRGDVEAAARALADKGVKVFSLGIGTAAGTPVPVLDAQGRVASYLQDDRGQTVVTRLEEGQLRRIAEITGGRYVAGLGGDIGMGEIFAELENLEKTEFDSKASVQYADIWHWLGFPGFVFLFLGACIGDGRKAGLAVIGLAVWLPAAAHASPFEKPLPVVAEGLAAWEKGDFEGALKAFETAAVSRPDLAAIHFNRGNALYRLGRFEEAKEAYLEALARREDEGGAAKDYTNLGNVWAALGKDEEAIASFRRALQIDPEATVARHNLEVLLRRQQQDEQKQDEQKQDEQKQDEQKQDEQKQDEQKQDEQKQDEQKQDEQKQDDQQQDGQKQDGQQQGEQKQGEQQQGEQQQDEQQQDEQQQGEQKQDGQKQDGQKQDGQKQDEQEKSGGVPPAPAPGAPEEPEQPLPATRSEAERLLDSLRDGEKNFQLWRYQKKKGTTHDPKDW